MIGANFNLHEALATLYKESSQFVDTTNFAIALYDKTTDTLNFALVADHGEQVKPFVLECAHHRGLTHYVLITQNPLLFEDLSELEKVDVETARIHPDKPILTWLGAPIPNPFRLGRNAQGVISMWSYQANAFGENDLQVLSTIADQAAISLRYVQLAELLQQRAIEMAVVNDVAQLLVSTLDWQELLARITEQIEGMFRAEMGVLFLKDTSAEDLVFEAILAVKPPKIEPFRLPFGKGLAGRTAQTRQALLIAHASTEQKGEIELQKIGLTMRDGVVVPLVAREQLVGVLEIFNQKKGGFTESDLVLLNAVGNYIAIAIENIKLHNKAKSTAPQVVQAAPVQIAPSPQLPSDPTELVSGIISRFEALQNEPSLPPNTVLKVQQIADQTVQQMKGILFELHPFNLQTEGLIAALQSFIEQQQKEQQQKATSKLKLSLKLKPLDPDNPIVFTDNKVETAIFAIIQEAVRNAISHAKAKNIMLQVTEHPEAFYILVADDGIGFDASETEGQDNSGIACMQKQAELIGSELRVKTAPGMGTHIFLYLPKEESDNDFI